MKNGTDNATAYNPNPAQHGCKSLSDSSRNHSSSSAGEGPIGDTMTWNLDNDRDATNVTDEACDECGSKTAHRTMGHMTGERGGCRVLCDKCVTEELDAREDEAS